MSWLQRIYGHPLLRAKVHEDYEDQIILPHVAEIATKLLSRERGVWTHNGDKVCITCPKCAAISMIVDHRLDDKGHVEHECVVCAKCGAHWWMFLEDWRENTTPEMRTRYANNPFGYEDREEDIDLGFNDDE